MMKNIITQPWSRLPEQIKQWVRTNGYVIRESTTGATYYAAWRDAYLNTMGH